MRSYGMEVISFEDILCQVRPLGRARAFLAAFLSYLFSLVLP